MPSTPFQSSALLSFALALVSGCSRNVPTDELIARSRKTTIPTWLEAPCQELKVDEFGWTLDSLDGIAFRVPASLRRLETTAFRQLAYRTSYSTLLLTINPSHEVAYSALVTDGNVNHRERCSIANRVATVSTSRTGNSGYTTAVLWTDIGDGRTLLATAAARTADEVQLLRAVLFTMKFPE